MATKIQLRRGLAERWTSANPTLALGEMGIETDTRKFKFGDGSTAWNSLPYASADSGEIPTKLSQLTNDCGFITIADVEGKNYTTMSAVEAKGYITATALEPYAKKTELPTKTSDLDNDSNFTTLSDVAEEGYTKNVGTVTSVNGIEPTDGNVDLSDEIPTKVSDLENDEGFIKEEVSKEGFDIVQVIAARQYDNYTATVSGNYMPWTLFGGAKLANQRLYSIGYDSATESEHVFGYIPSGSAWDIDTNRTSYSLFKINAEIGYHTYMLDGSDSRVTILTDNLVDGFPTMPDVSTFCIVSGSGIRTFNNQDIRAKDQNLIYLNGSNQLAYSAYETALDIKIALPSTSTTKVAKKENEDGVYQNYKAKRPASTNPAEWGTASAGAAPYVYYNNEDIQDCNLVSIGLGCQTTGATVKFWLGQCNGSTADFIDYSVPLIPAFDIVLANTAYTEYKLDGTDSNVTIYDGAKVDGKVHIGKNQILCFCEAGAANQFAYVSKAKQDGKLIEEDQWFCGTNNWTSLTTVTQSAMNVGITVEKEKKVVDQLNPLKGKKVSIIGDSISTYAGYIPEGYAIAYPKWDVTSPDDCWWMKVIKKGDMVLGQDCSWSGSKVCGTATGDSAAAACSDQRIKDLAINGDPDIVICFIGTNDVGNKATMGEWHKGDTIPENTGTVSTMSEAYALMVWKIMKTYPLARVFCCSLPERKRVSGEKITEYPMVSNGLTLYDFNDMVKEVCEALGATFIDLHGCGMTWWNAETYLVWEEKGVLHPNKLGMELFAKCIYSAIANDYKINRGE